MPAGRSPARLMQAPLVQDPIGWSPRRGAWRRRRPDLLVRTRRSAGCPDWPGPPRSGLVAEPGEHPGVVPAGGLSNFRATTSTGGSSRTALQTSPWLPRPRRRIRRYGPTRGRSPSQPCPRRPDHHPGQPLAPGYRIGLRSGPVRGMGERRLPRRDRAHRARGSGGPLDCVASSSTSPRDSSQSNRASDRPDGCPRAWPLNRKVAHDRGRRRIASPDGAEDRAPPPRVARGQHQGSGVVPRCQDPPGTTVRAISTGGGVGPPPGSIAPAWHDAPDTR